MEPQFIKSFIQIIKEQIAADNTVNVNGLGQFQKVHQSQSHKRMDDGSVVLVPPKNKIEFKSDISRLNDD